MKCKYNQPTLKAWYICHFLNNYDLNKGRFIVSRSPGRLPRGFCISNQRLFVLSGPESSSTSSTLSRPESRPSSTSSFDQSSFRNVTSASLKKHMNACFKAEETHQAKGKLTAVCHFWARSEASSTSSSTTAPHMFWFL